MASKSIYILFFLFSLQKISATEDSYLRYIKDGCFIRGEALSCVKYKAIKIAKNTIFGDINSNVTIKANKMVSLVTLDEETVKNLTVSEKETVLSEPRSIMSEWSQLAKYFMKLVQDFFKMKGLRVNLPEGARTVEDDEAIEDDARGKKKRLAIIVPLLTLLAAIKTKLLLIPILLSVLLIKKLLLIAALLLPSLLSTLKACKHHHPMTHYSYFGSSDASDFNSDYANTYSYASGAGYGKDWPSNRAYSFPKHRPTPASAYITAPGAIA